QTPAQASAPTVPSRAVSGKWSGAASSNWGNTANCRNTLQLEASATDGKVSASIKFIGGGRHKGEAQQQPGGRLEKSDGTGSGNRISVTGQFADTVAVMSVWNPNDCGYRNVPLKA